MSSAENQEHVSCKEPVRSVSWVPAMDDGFHRDFGVLRYKKCVASEAEYLMHQRSRATFLAALCIAAGIACFSSGAGADVLNFSFEPGNPNPIGLTGPLNGLNYHSNATEAELSTEQARVGTRSIKTYLNRLTSSVSYRAETVLNVNHSIFHFDSHRGAATQDYWLGISVRMKAPYGKDKNFQWTQNIFNFHNAPPQPFPTPTGTITRWNGNSQPFSIDLEPLSDTHGVVRISVGGGGLTGFCDPIDCPRKMAVVIRPVEYVADQWHDIVMHLKMTPDSAGFWRMWWDGVKVLDYSGPVDHVGNGHPYPKFGLYIGWKDRQMDDPVYEKTLYHDEFKVAWGAGVGYDDVAPGAGQPTNPKDPPLAPTGLKVVE